MGSFQAPQSPDEFLSWQGQQKMLDPGGFFTSTPTPATAGGYYGQNQINNQINQGYATSNQAAPQLDPSQQAQFRQMQMQQAQQLQGIASGQQQGAGELAAQRQVQNALAAQQAQARMARGTNSALAFRGAANNSAGIGMAGAGMAQQAALQDQSNAQGALTGALGTARGADIGMAGQNANLTQQQYGLNTQRGLGYLGQQTGMGRDQLAMQLGQYNTDRQNQQQMQGGLLSTAGAMFAMSDERQKTDIQDAGSDIDDMLGKLVAKTYRYKDEAKYGEGERAGVMAQDLAKSKAGSALLANLPEGVGFDVGKAVSAALASAARLHARMRKLEGARG